MAGDPDAPTDADADADAAPDRGTPLPDGGTAEADGAVEGGHAGGDPAYDDWYRWGRVVLYLEMLLAVLVTVFSLYLAFTGQAGFLT